MNNPSIKKLSLDLKFVYSDNNSISVVFQNNDLLMGVVGEFNLNLKELEKLTSTNIYFRGNSILIKSDSGKNEIVKNAIQFLAEQFINNGSIEKKDIVSSVEIVTNGDALTSKMLKNLYSANASRVLVSMYDGPEQIKKFKKIIKSSKVPEELVILRDRWYDKVNNFGVKLTNRTGTIKIGNQVSNSTHTTCFYPSYQFLIDWNGDVFLCPQDWQRRRTMGNMMQENIFNIWVGKIITRYRKQLLKGKRISSPCNSCNAQGTLLGQNHAKIWRELYK